METIELFCGAGGGAAAHAHLLGHHPIALAEVAAYPLQVLRARVEDGSLPKATIYTDVRHVKGSKYHGIGCVSGGSPCQGLSAAGKGLGLDDPRSVLVFEMLRIVAEARPKHVFLENSPRLRLKGLGRILAALNAIGYGDVVWGVISGADVGAPHIRQRMWLLAKRGGAVASMREPLSPPANGRLHRGTVTVQKPWVSAQTRRGSLPTLIAADAKASGNRPDPTLWSLSDMLGITAKARKHGVQTLPTLAATDWKSPYGLQGLMEQLKKRSKPLRDILPYLEGGRSINPMWAEWYMGWCPDWTDLSVKPDVRAWLKLTRRGAWWTDDVEASVLPRTLKTGEAVPNTGPRIKALGNGQIPLCAAVSFHVLQQALD